MGKRGRKNRGRPVSGSSTPHPALLGAVIVVAALVALQTAGLDMRTWFPADTGNYTELPQSDAQIFQEFIERESRGDTTTRKEADWLYGKAKEYSLATKLATQPLVNNAIGVHQLASWAAKQFGLADRRLELSFRLAKALPMVEDDTMRRQLYSNIVSRHMVPFEDYIEVRAIPLLTELLDTAYRVGDYEALSSLYTDRARAIHRVDGLEAAIDSLDECFERAQTNSQVLTTNCRHGKALFLLWNGDVKAALERYLEAHDDRLREFHAPPYGHACNATQHRLALETTSAVDRANTPHLTVHSHAAALDERLKEVPTFECTTQEWPWFLLSPRGSDRPATDFVTVETIGSSADGTWQKAEWHDSSMDKIQCVRDGDKTLQLYELEDVYVHGIFKTVSSSDCHVIQTGFAYCSSFSRPHILPSDITVQELDEVVMLPAMERNYFHMTVEGSQQLLFPQLFDVLGGRRLPVLVVPQNVSVNVVRILDFPVSSLVAYEHQHTAYHVKKLFVSDWVYPEIDPTSEQRHHTEEYYVPPQSHLWLLRQDLMKNIEIAEVARTVVVLNRTAGATGAHHARTILEFDEFLDAITAAAQRYGLKVLIHSGSMLLEEQIQMFHSAELVIGSHGAGLTNILYCQPGASMIELPSFPRKPSVYSMMASALGIDVWSLPSADAYRFGVYRMNESNLRQLRFTVDYILHSKGYKAASADGEWPAWK